MQETQIQSLIQEDPRCFGATKSMHAQSLSHVQLFATHGMQPTRLLCPCNSPGKTTGVSCHFLLQRIFPTQGLNLGLSHCRQILYCLSPQESLLSTSP